MEDDDYEYDYDDAGPSGSQEEEEEVEQGEQEEEEYDYSLSPTPQHDFTPSEPGSSSLRPEKSQTMTVEEFSAHQLDIISSISSIMEAPLGAVGNLLRIYKWNKERLLELYFADPAGLFSKHGMSAKFQPMKAGTAAEELTCGICFCDYPGNECASLSCNHVFCNGCWSDYVNSRTESKDTCLLTFCPHPKCESMVDESAFKSFCTPESWKRYSHFIALGYVDANPNVRWCPSASCGLAVVAAEGERNSVVTCICGTTFCFNCNGEPHTPASCDDLKAWKKKDQDEGETTKWLSANTKDCPNCHVAIEKNQGCNHMTCRSCKHEFCWLCFGNWRGHSSCNRYDDKEADREKTRAVLKRYMHYHTRYVEHERSKRLEAGLLQKATQKMTELQNSRDMTYFDTEYVLQACQQLFECRRCLKWTYVHAFYLAEGSPEKMLFEFLQSELEASTERLSGILEDKGNRFSRDEVKNTTRLAKLKLDKLLADSIKGLTSDESLI